MYEQFKNEFLVELSTTSKFTNEDIQTILSCLDIAANKYEITQKETALTVYNNELPSLVKTYIVCKSIEGFSEKTLYNYTRHLKNFFATVQLAPEQVTANDVRIYLFNYQQHRGISNRSLDKVRSAIAGFYNWMHAEGYIDRNPLNTVQKIKYEKKPKEPCTQMDLEYLRLACETKKQKAILEVLYSTGCRVGELVILKKSDIDWHEKTVHLFGKGKKHRTSFLNARAEVALKEYLDTRTDKNDELFVSDRAPHDPMHVCGVQKIIRELNQRASKHVHKKVTPHTLRRTMASTALQRNCSIDIIQTILGHENINTTLIYAQNSKEKVKAEHIRCVI